MKKITSYTICVIACWLLCACSPNTPDTGTLSSPEQKLVLHFSLDDSGVPRYSVEYEGETVITPSRLGFVLQDSMDWASGFEIVSSKRTTVDETWDMVWGEVDSVRNHYHELTVELQTVATPKRNMNLHFRAYDDGVGFRYEIPAQAGMDSVFIMDELTQLGLRATDTAWWIPANYDSYEHLYSETPLAAVDSVNTPITLKTQAGKYLSIHEAALLDYTDMTLRRTSGGTLEANLVPWPDGVKVRTRLPMKTPWRMIQVGQRPGDLIASKLILNLNEPTQLTETDWIKPMKYVGIWWGMHIGTETWAKTDRHGATTENAKRHIDFAAANNIGGVLVEGWNAGWENWLGDDFFDFTTAYEDFDLEEVARYAEEKDVELIGHHETGGDILGYERHVEEAFALYHQLGVEAVKTGYAGNIMVEGQWKHGQYMIQHYTEVMKLAAQYQITLNVHEPIKFTGLRRTYPNLMTGEGVRGMEWNAWSDGNPPRHTTIVPFTRMLAGPVDYTPGIFDPQLKRYEKDRVHWHPADPDKDKGLVQGTLARQMALMVVLYSPLQMAADLPENYEGNPAFQFIRDLAVDWDDTQVLAAQIGDYVAIARKKADEWFIGAVTNEAPRELTLDLSFLDPGKPYEATIYADGADGHYLDNPTAVEIRTQAVTREARLSVDLAAGGGQCIRIVPK